MSRVTEGDRVRALLWWRPTSLQLWPPHPRPNLLFLTGMIYHQGCRTRMGCHVTVHKTEPVHCETCIPQVLSSCVHLWISEVYWLGGVRTAMRCGFPVFQFPHVFFFGSAFCLGQNLIMS